MGSLLAETEPLGGGGLTLRPLAYGDVRASVNTSVAEEEVKLCIDTEPGLVVFGSPVTPGNSNGPSSPAAAAAKAVRARHSVPRRN